MYETPSSDAAAAARGVAANAPCDCFCCIQGAASPSPPSRPSPSPSAPTAGAVQYQCVASWTQEEIDRISDGSWSRQRACERIPGRKYAKALSSEAGNVATTDGDRYSPQTAPGCGSCGLTMCCVLQNNASFSSSNAYTCIDPKDCGGVSNSLRNIVGGNYVYQTLGCASPCTCCGVQATVGFAINSRMFALPMETAPGKVAPKQAKNAKKDKADSKHGKAGGKRDKPGKGSKENHKHDNGKQDKQQYKEQLSRRQP